MYSKPKINNNNLDMDMKMILRVITFQINLEVLKKHGIQKKFCKINNNRNSQSQRRISNKINQTRQFHWRFL